MSSSRETWEKIYSDGQQLNRYPYTEVVSFFFGKGLQLNGGHALDVGCGSGVHCRMLADHNFTVTGFDGSAAGIQQARDMHGGKGIAFRHSYFEDFDPGNERYDLVIDRLSSSQTSPKVVSDLYTRLRPNVTDNAWVFWMGFDWDNSGRSFGTQQPDGSFDNFTGGVFAQYGKTGFYRKEEIAQTFPGYKVETLSQVARTDADSGYRHSFWEVVLRPA